MKRLTSRENLEDAWLEVRSKAAGGGVDRQTVDGFAWEADKHLAELQKELLAGDYVPEPYLEIWIPKDDGDRRSLGLPTVRDKIAQQAARQVLEPLLEPLFADISYGYRARKGPYRAVRRALDFIRHRGMTWLADCDIDSFFDRILHDRLMAMLGKHVPEPALLHLIRLWISMGRVERGGDWQEVTNGIPQGAVISPLLANFYLNDFDHFLLEQQYGLVRFADDFIVLAETESRAEAALAATKQYLEQELGLALNPGSVVLSADTGFEFLGIWFKGTETTLHPEKFAALEKGFIEDLALKGTGLAPETWPRIRGTQNYYGRLLPNEAKLALDAALLRACWAQLMIWRKEGVLPAAALKPPLLRELTFCSEEGEQQAAAWKRRLLRAVRRKQAGLLDSLTALPYQRGPVRLQPLPADPESSSDPQLKALRKIRKQQLAYRRKATQSQELLINRPGVMLSRTKGRLVVKEKGKVKLRIPLAHLEHITIQAKGVVLSTNLLRACMKRDIPVYFLEPDGMPWAHLHAQGHPDVEHGLAQLKAYENGRGIVFAKKVALGKVRNQRTLIKYLAKSGSRSRPDLRTLAEEALIVMEREIDLLKAEKGTELSSLRTRLMAAEGRAAAAYWGFVRQCLPAPSVFPGRIAQGAADPVNAALNYGYGILYSRVQVAIVSARLFLNLAYLHAPGGENRPSLAFDLIEEFRVQAVDRPVLTMLRRELPLQLTEGKLLDRKSRQRVARKVLDRLGRYESFDGDTWPLGEIIRLQARRLAEYLEGERKNYKPYVGRW